MNHFTQQINIISTNKLNKLILHIIRQISDKLHKLILHIILHYKEGNFLARILIEL